MSTELIRADLLRSASRASAAPLIAGTAIRTFAATAGVRGRTGPLTAELSAAEADRLALARNGRAGPLRARDDAVDRASVTIPGMSAPDPSALPRASRRVADELARLGHLGQVRVLEDSARSAAEAAAALGVEQRQIVKSLVFRGRRSGRAVLVLVGGTSRVDVARLAAHLGEPVERADADWVREQTGFSIGGVPPIGHRDPVRTVADAGLVELEELWAAAGTPHTVFPLRGGELVQLTGAEPADISASERA